MGAKDSKKKKEKGTDFSNMSVEEIVNHKREIESLLASLEDEYRKAAITEASYKELKEKNKKRLDEVKAVLTDWGIKDEGAPPAGQTKTEQPITQGPPAQPAQAAPQPAPPAKEPASQPARKAEASMQPDFAGQLQGMLASSLGMQRELLESKMMMEIEKINVQLGALKEAKNAADERLQRAVESIGEIRSTVMQREASLAKEEALVKKLEDEVSGIKPTEIAKEFAKRDKSLSEIAMRTEVLEDKMKMMAENMAHVQTLLRGVGNLENIAGINKNVSSKVAVMEDYLQKVDRISDKIEKIYVDMNKKLEDFVFYKAKQDSMDELLKDMMKSADEASVKMQGFVAKEDINSMRGEIAGVASKLDETKSIINMIIPVVELKMPEKIQRLRKEREDITALLSELEEGHSKGTIKDEEYKQAREANEKKLGKIEKVLKSEWESLQQQKPGGSKGAENAGESQPANKMQQEQAAKPQKNDAPKPDEKTSENKEEKKDDAANPASPAEKGMEGEKEEKPAQPAIAGNAQNETKKTDEDPSKEKNQEAKEEAVQASGDAGKKEQAAKPAEVPAGNENSGLIAELEDSFKKGLISMEAFMRTKKLLSVA